MSQLQRERKFFCISILPVNYSITKMNSNQVYVYEIKFTFFKKKNFLLKLQIRMDQYFDRLDKATRNEQLPVRIRFMIQDVIDMRRNKWQPRRIGKGKKLQNLW